MREIGLFEAKNRLGTLLEWVETGEEVVITRRGKAVARLVPMDAVADRQAARKAAADILARRSEAQVGGLQILDLIRAGRR